MTTDTAERIIQYITEHQEVTPHQLREYLGIGAPALFRQLKKLLQHGTISKTGRPPKVFYQLAGGRPVAESSPALKKDLEKLLSERWLHVTPLGVLEEGATGFAAWCQSRSLPVEKTALEYRRTLQKYEAFRKNDLINGLPKLHRTFPQVFLDELYYLDFYSIERFGKTKLGALLLYAKQSQSRALMTRLFNAVKPRINRLVTGKRIEAVGFVPPTVARMVQLQKELERTLALTLPTLKIVKATTAVAVAQKTLSSLADRVENAAGSIFVENATSAKRILLIDDAVGSGASMNETARKIKQKNPRAYVIGLAITGSFKGFEVLNEV